MAAVSPSSPTKLTPRVVGRAIDRARVTRPLMYIMIVAALGYLFDSFDISIVSYALPSIASEFRLTPDLIGLVGSAGLIGMAVGSYFWGWLADQWGRLAAFAATVLVFALFSGLAAVSLSVGFLIGARFLTGTGLGGTIPVDSTLMTEYSPARIRGRLAGALPLAFPIGIFLAAGVGLWIVPTFGWRWLFVVGIIPALIAFWARLRVPESPRWLAGRDRLEDARKSLHYIGITNAALDEAERDVANEPAMPVEAKPRVSDLFAPELRRRVVHTWALWFFQNFTFWGFQVWLPTVYATVYHISLVRTLQYVFLVTGTQVVGRILAFYLIDRIGRKPIIIYGYTISGLAALAFTQATTDVSLVACAMVFAFFMDQGALAMTVYTPEVYPLRIRALGAASAMGLGRIGGAISPIIVGALLVTTGITAVWVIFAASVFIAVLFTVFIGEETKGRNLEKLSEVIGPTEPRESLAA